MAIAPTSDIYLLDVPLDITQKNQLYWVNPDSRIPYFQTRIKHTVNNATYIRKDNVLKIPALIDTLYDSNYVMYQNDSYGSKWFFAFITKMEYVNDGCTHVHIKTDVFQTWYSEAVIKESFVEREHVSNDAKFTHLLPEPFESGEPVLYGTKNILDLNQMGIVVVYIDFDPGTGNIDVIAGEMRSNVFTGLKYLYFGTTQTDIDNLNSILNGFAAIGKLDNIVNVFMIPTIFITDPNTSNEFDGIIPTSLDGYTPKNNKLFNFPYNYLTISNCNGEAGIYRYEYFDNPNDFYFGLYCAYNDKPSCAYVPLYYKGNPCNWDEGIMLDNFPVCAWVGDVYKNWYAQNDLVIEHTKLKNFFGMAGGVASTALTAPAGAPLGNAAIAGVGGAVSSLSSTMDLLVQIEQKKLFPEQLRGKADGQRFNAAQNRIGFEACRMTIKSEFAKVIDDFFELYGYKVCEVKIPNRSSRPYWNFIKTIDINITGAIPSDDMEELKTMYNNGLTLWHNPAYFCDYSQNNH